MSIWARSLKLLLYSARTLRALCVEYLLLDAVATSRMRLRLAQAARMAALLGVGAASVGVMRPAWFRPNNLALHRPAVAGSSEFGTTPGAAVDGVRYGELGFHSGLSDPSLTVDLEAAVRLDRIDVYGRADCCFEQSVPLQISSSLDGRRFQPLATRETDFSQTDPWSLRVSPPVSARYLRFTTLRKSYLVLGEVEAYGSRQ
jgi:hypothetical protein